MSNRQFNTRQQYVDCCRAENEALLASLPRKAWIQYVRQPSPGLNQRGAPRGVVIIYRKGSHLVAGGSFCHRRDRFDRHIGLRKAIRSVAVVPPSLDFGTAAPDHRWLAAFPQGCRATLRAMLVHCRAQEGRQAERAAQAPQTLS